MRSLRVMLVTNGLRYGGAERIVEALALGLTAAGDEVTVVATTRGGPIAESLAAAKIRVEVLGLRSAFDARVPLRLARLAHASRSQLLHSHLAVADISVALASALYPPARRVSTVHNSGVELEASRRALWSLTLHRFDRVLAVSEATQRPLRVASQLLRPSLVEPNEPILSREEARARLGLPLDAKVILSAGRLVPVKGFDVLARAAQQLKTPNAIVGLIGEGPERGALEAQAHLRLFGARPDAAQLLAAADVVACPSRSEGFPQVPLEAMGAARPLVGARIDGLSEVIEDGCTGILVPPEHPQALATALDALLCDPARAEALGRMGRVRLLARGLTRGAMVAAHRQLYAALVLA